AASARQRESSSGSANNAPESNVKSATLALERREGSESREMPVAQPPKPSPSKPAANKDANEAASFPAMETSLGLVSEGSNTAAGNAAAAEPAGVVRPHGRRAGRVYAGLRGLRGFRGFRGFRQPSSASRGSKPPASRVVLEPPVLEKMHDLARRT